MAQETHTLRENDDEAQDLAHGQIVIVTARWILVFAGLLLVLWNPGPIGQMRLQVAIIILLAFANFYLQSEILRKKPTVKAVTYLATAGDLAIITLIVISQGGFSSNAYVFYFPAILAFSVAFPTALTSLLTFAILLTYLSISAVSLGSLALDGITIPTSDIQAVMTRLIMFAAVAACGNLYRRIEHSRRSEAAEAEQQLRERSALARASAGDETRQAIGTSDRAMAEAELHPGGAEAEEPAGEKPPASHGIPTWLWLTAAMLSMSCTAVVAVFAGLLSPGRSEASALISQGHSLGQDGDCERAIERFNQAIVVHPRSAEAYEGRAACYVIEGDYELAQADCDYLIETWPNDTRGYLCLTFMYKEKEDYEGVIDASSHVIELDPEDSDAYNKRAWYLALTGGDLEQALADANRAVELQSNEPHYYDTRGFVYYKLGHYDKALEDYDTAIGMNLDYAHYGRGLTYEALGDAANAITDYTLFLDANPSLDPESGDARKHLQALEAELTSHCLPESSAPSGRNLALRTPVLTSRSEFGFPRNFAVDDNFETWWGAGANAPQWIEIELYEPVTISRIRLIPSQSPSGLTVHEVWVKTATAEEYYLVGICAGTTRDGLAIDIRPALIEEVRFVRIVTTDSPSWVGWREIQVFGPD